MPSVFKLLIICVFCISFGNVACGQTEKTSNTANKPDESKTNVDEKVSEKIGENSLTLKNEGGKCQLLFDELRIELDLPWNCDFHRSAEGKIRVFPQDFYQAKNKPTPKAYRQTQIILIENSRPVEATPKECRTSIQGIKIINGKVTKSVVMDNLSACPPFQWDAKNFTGLF